MNHPFDPAGNIVLVRTVMGRQEHERRRHENRRSRRSLMTTIRSFTGGALIAAGTRIIPAERPGRTQPVVGTMSTVH